MFIKLTEECYVNIGEGPVEMVEVDKLSMGHEGTRVMLRFRGDGHGKILPSDLTIDEVIKKLNDGLFMLRMENKPLYQNYQQNPPNGPHYGGPGS